jgi:hypothetical protein
MSIPSIFSDNVANIPDKLGEINGRWTAVITKATGQAGPYIFVYRGRINITGNDGVDQFPGREWFADQRQGTGGRTFPAVLTCKGIMIRNDLGQSVPADTFCFRYWDRQQGAWAQQSDLIAKVIQEFQ